MISETNVDYAILEEIIDSMNVPKNIYVMSGQA